MKHVRQHGFTLVELMIVIAIVGILAGIAYPSYLNQVAKSRRSQARSVLQDMQLLQERWRSNNATYGTIAQIGGTASDDFYNYTVTNTGASTYTLTATATGAQSSDDSACTPLTLDQSNARLPATCW